MIPEQREAVARYVTNNGYRIVREPPAESISTPRILPVKNVLRSGESLLILGSREPGVGSGIGWGRLGAPRLSFLKRI